MNENIQLIKDGKRIDGRAFNELRELKITAGVLKKADGSAFIEWGKNKVLAAVYRPREVLPKHLTNPYKAIVNCRYAMAPFSSTEEHGRSGPNRRSVEIGKVAKHVFENAILIKSFPNTMIDVHMEVLQSDGGTRVAGITAASVALADAGVPIKDLVCGVSVGKIGGEIVVDLNKEEDNQGSGDMPIVLSLRSGEVLLWQMDGMFTKEEIRKCFDKAFEAATKIREIQEAALKARCEAVYQTPEEGYEAKPDKFTDENKGIEVV